MIESSAFTTSTQVRPLNLLLLVGCIGLAIVGEGPKADNTNRKQ